MELTIIAVIILILIGVIYYMTLLWKMVRWLLKHVHVVSKSDEKDPELKRIKSTFGIED